MKRLGSVNADSNLVPFPIQFEQIAAEQGCMMGKRGADPYVELRRKMQSIIEQVESKPGDLHLAFRDIDFDHVITTNYDSVFESMYDYEDLIINPGSSKNILGAIRKAKSLDFYHAHGIAKWKGTLCLSHEHYISLITKIRKTFFTSDSDENKEVLSDIVVGRKEPTNTWPELLFTNDVAIVGLGLDYSEIDLWWLLAQRAAVFAPCRHLSEYENRIMYYYFDLDADSRQFESKVGALKSLGVEPVHISSNNYPDGYRMVAQKLKDEWGTRRAMRS